MDGLLRVTQLRRTLAVVLAGVAATALGGWAALSADHGGVRRELQAQARLHAKIIESHFSDLEHPVLSAADFAAADLDHTPQEFLRFASFAAPHAALVQWLAWAPLVRDRDSFEATARLNDPQFRILDRSGGRLAPASQRPFYFPLYAVQNFQGRIIPLGLDIAGNPILRDAAQAARDEGHAVATPPIQGFFGGESGRVTAIVAPIYRDGLLSLRGVTGRREALTGYVVGVYGIDAVLGFVTAGVANPDERISFAPPQPVARFGQAIAAEHDDNPANSGMPLSGPARIAYSVVQPLTFSGQSWTATFGFAPQALAKRSSYAPFVWIGAGLLLTTALGTVTARSETQRLATERLVTTRTRELSTANERLHQSAETLQATLAAAPLGIIALDPDGRITSWNRGAERIFGHTEAEAVGRPYYDIVVAPEHRAEADALFERISRGEPLRDVAVQRQRRDGTPLDIRVGGNPMHDADGRLQGVVFANQDITESRRLEEQLRQAQKMDAIGQLTGGVAHDFNNLLGTAITSLDLLRDRVENDAESSELTGDALDALLHGVDLVRRLLAFARRQPLMPETIRLNGLVLEVVRLVRPLLGDAVQIALDLGDESWPVLIDRAQFETTLINLATNARDAMPYGGALSIRTRNVAVTPQSPVQNLTVPPGDYIMVEVRDTGIGMSLDLQQRIFEPFFTTKGKAVGTGLGLCTVLGFIQQSGGYIGVESEPGRGSRFRLYLARHDADAHEVPSVRHEPSDAIPRGRGEQVLVVEDNPGLRHIVLLQLKKLGYLVADAAEATAALAVLESGRRIDLLFTDIMLPGGMSGVQLAAAARTRWPDLKILLTSGFPEALLEEPTALAGLPLINKPYREEALARMLREVLAG